MFLDSDERLMVVDFLCNQMSFAGRKALHDEAGVKTILSESVVSWHEIEPVQGQYNYDRVNRYIDECRQIGLKVAFQFYVTAPHWVPGVMVRHGQCYHYDVPNAYVNPFNVDGFQAELEFIYRTLEHISAPDVMGFYGMPRNGERLLLKGMTCTEEQAVDIVISRQACFAQWSDELWTAFHPNTVHEGSGNEHFGAIYKALSRTFPTHTERRLLWTFFSCRTPPKIDDRYWCGAQYARKVERNSAHLENAGGGGVIVGPYHPLKEPGVVTPKIVRQIGNAVKILGGQL